MSLQSYRAQIRDLHTRVERHTRPRAPYRLTPSELFDLTIGGAPDAWQADVLEAEQRQIILNCSRQAGKSTTMAAIAVDTLLSRRNALVVVTSASVRQARELLRTIREVHSACDQGARCVASSVTRMAFSNGSRAVALPANPATVRGFAKAALVLIDEAAYVADPVYRALRPMLAVSGGRLVLGSTPFGKRGFFFEEWQQGGGDWLRISVPAPSIPRITPEFLAAERRAMGDLWFSQEYTCAFVENLFAVFDFETVMAAITDEVKPLFARG